MLAVVARMAHWPLEYDDAVGYGQLGLVEAANGFDQTRGIKFSTYAGYRIRGAILDAMRQADPLPRHARDFVNGHPPPERTTPYIHKQKVRGHVTYAFYSTLQITSMDAHHQRTEECEELADPFPDQPDEGDEYDWSALFAALDPRERAIVQLTVLADRKGPAIARRLGVSEARVGQIKRRAYKKLRKLVKQQRVA